MTAPKRTAAAVAAEAMLKAEEALSVNVETNRLVKDLHQALMVPQPGYDRPFLHRAADVVMEAEAGKIVGEKVVLWAKWVTALGVITSSLWAVVRLGHNPKG